VIGNGETRLARPDLGCGPAAPDLHYLCQTKEAAAWGVDRDFKASQPRQPRDVRVRGDIDRGFHEAVSDPATSTASSFSHREASSRTDRVILGVHCASPGR